MKCYLVTSAVSVRSFLSSVDGLIEAARYTGMQTRAYDVRLCALRKTAEGIKLCTANDTPELLCYLVLCTHRQAPEMAEIVEDIDVAYSKTENYKRVYELYRPEEVEVKQLPARIDQQEKHVKNRVCSIPGRHAVVWKGTPCTFVAPKSVASTSHDETQDDDTQPLVAASNDHLCSGGACRYECDAKIIQLYDTPFDTVEPPQPLERDQLVHWAEKVITGAEYWVDSLARWEWCRDVYISSISASGQQTYRCFLWVKETKFDCDEEKTLRKTAFNRHMRECYLKGGWKTPLPEWATNAMQFVWLTNKPLEVLSVQSCTEWGLALIFPAKS